jgi:hypothetical protein
MSDGSSSSTLFPLSARTIPSYAGSLRAQMDNSNPSLSTDSRTASGARVPLNAAVVVPLLKLNHVAPSLSFLPQPLADERLKGCPRIEKALPA